MDALVSKEVTTIFKKKNTYIAVRNGKKYAVGDGKLGKYYSLPYNKLFDMVANKGYTEFYKQGRNENDKNIVCFRTEELKQLPFQKVEWLEL